MKKYKNSPTMCELRFIRLSLKLLWHNIPLFSFWHYPPCYYPLHRKQRETKRMQVQRKPQSIHVPTALQSRGDLLAENAFTLSHATFVATMCTRRIVSCISESSTQTVCKYIQGHCGNFKLLIMSVSYSDASSVHYRVAALCFLNEPFIQSRSIFTIFHSWIFFT